MLIVNSVLFVAAIAAAIYAIIDQNWWQLAYTAFPVLVGLSNLSLNRRTLRYLRDLQVQAEAA